MRKWWLWLILVVAAVALASGINMFRYPYYENDEGTYMSQAWAIINMGQLAPYTYTYDHAPLGWMLIAAWTQLTGGFFKFGFSINSGRVMMLVLQVTSTILIYLVSYKFLKNRPASLIAALVFGLSPMGIYFHRRVLLDNIMVFWMLLSLWLLLIANNKPIWFYLSALSLGLAAASKEYALLFLPVFLYIAYKNNQDKDRWLRTGIWLLVSLSPIIVYILYAISQGQFLPSDQHPSLISTWLIQLGRGGGSIFNPNSLVNMSIKTWFQSDPFIMVLGILSSIFNLYLGIKNINYRYISFLATIYVLFIIKGGTILEFYFLPLLPFLALNLAGTIHYLAKKSEKLKYAIYLTTTIGTLLNLAIFSQISKTVFNLYTSNQTQSQIEAVNYILSQNMPDVFYVIDNYSYVDLHANQDSHFKYAEYYWKVDTDPKIKQILADNWKFISYLAVTPQMATDLENSNLPLVQAAFSHSTLIQQFYSDRWGVKIYLVNPGN